MLRSNLSRVVVQCRWIKTIECTLCSTIKHKTSGDKHKPKEQKSVVLNEIIKLTKKKNVAKADMDAFLTTFPMSTLNGADIASLVSSLAKTKYPFDSTELAQITTLLNSTELVLNAKCLGSMFYGLRCVNQRGHTNLQLETTDLLKALTNRLRSSPDMQKPTHISLLLFGLQNFSCDLSGRASSLVVRDLLKEITTKVSSSSPGWSGRDVGSALYGLRGTSSHVPEVRELLASLLQKLNAEPSNITLNPQEIGNSVFGLQKMSSKSKEVVGVLEYICEKLMSCESPPFKGVDISNILTGLRNMSSSEPNVRDLLASLVDKVDQCTDEFSGSQLGSSFYAFHNMSSDHREVRNLLSALTLQMQRSSKKMSSQEVSNSLYGLRKMSSEHESVRRLVGVLADRVQACAGSFRAFEISMAIYGMQSLSSEVPEVRALALALSSKLESCKDAFNAQCVGNSLYGLQNLTSSSEEVRLLLDKLNDKVGSCLDDLNEQNIGNSLYGFQNLSDDNPETRKLLSTVLSLIERSSSARAGNLTSQALGNCFFGLKNMSSASEEVLRAVEVLRLLIARSSGPLDNKCIVDAFYGMRSMSSESSEVRNLLSTLREKFQHSDIDSSLAPYQIANAFEGLQNMSSNDIEVREALRFLTDKCFRGKNRDIFWCHEALGSAMYGMKSMSAENEEVTHLLTHIADRMSLDESPMTAAQVSKVMFSLKEMNSTNPAVSRIITLMNQKIQSVELDGQAVANCLYGLQNMSSSDPAVTEFLGHLCDSIEAGPTVHMTQKCIGLAFFGLKCMTCETEEVRRVLALLGNLGAQCKQPFNAQAVSGSFAGLRGCHDNYIEVAEVLFMLRQRLEMLKESFNPLQLKNTFSGLRGLTSGSKDVKRVLGVLGDKIKSCSGKVDGLVVGEILYSMQRMNVEHPEVLAVLHALSEVVPPSTSEDSLFLLKSERGANTSVGGAKFDFYALGVGLYGLASMSQIHVATPQDQSIGRMIDRVKSSGIICHLIERILAHGANMTSAFLLEKPQNNGESGILPSHLGTVLRSLNLIELYTPQLPSASQDHIRQIRSNVIEIRGEQPCGKNDFSTSSAVTYGKNDFSTSSDMIDEEDDFSKSSSVDAIVKDLSEYFAYDPAVEVVAGEELEYFDTNIIVRLRSRDLQTVKFVLNIEIEGFNDNFPTKRRFAFLRHQFLKSRQGGIIDVVEILESGCHDAVGHFVELIEARLY